jgi:glycosyltransferase involved in cell wall biosynthesis
MGTKTLAFLNVAEELNIEDKVHFIGYQHNPFAYLKKSTIFC